MFIRLLFSQMVVNKLVRDQGICSPKTLVSISGEVITAICDVIRRYGGLVDTRKPYRGHQISLLVAKNLKLTMLIFKLIKQCSNHHDIYHVNSRRVLEYQDQGSWDRKDKQPQSAQEQLGKDHEAIILHLMLIRGQGVFH